MSPRVRLTAFLVIWFSLLNILARRTMANEEMLDIILWESFENFSHIPVFRNLADEYCDPHEPRTKLDLDPQIPLRPPFVQSDYLPWPMNVNIFEQICRISQGKQTSVPPLTNHSFPLGLNVPATCRSSSRVDLLLLISSDIRNYEQREAIRRLWGNTACWLGAKIKHVFLLETSSLSLISDPNIVEEQELYGDLILQVYAVDSEQASSYKLLLGFQWFLAFCSHAKWVLVVNDDQFVNPFNMVSFLVSVSEAMHERLAVGSVWYEPFARSTHRSWGREVNGTSVDERYPTFVATTGVLISSALIPKLYISMRFTQLTHHPDLFLAHALRKLFILPAHFDDFYAYNRYPKDHMNYNRAIVLPCGGIMNQTALWDSLKCEIYCQQ